MISTITEILHNALTYDPNTPMIFPTGIFWAMFLIFLPIFSMLRDSKLKMMIFVVVFSSFFYYKSSGAFVMMLLGTSISDWLLSKAIASSKEMWQRRFCLAVSLSLSLGLLLYFKYANFFLWNWNAMVQSNYQPLDLILPVGISFYTFQSISYMVDVYKGTVAPTRTWLEYAFFLTFFPALVAGPIVRADYFLPQIQNSRHATRTEMYAGLWLIILGVAKKAIIADYISQYNDLIFSSPGTYTGFETLMGVVGYVMQIYCDFSGYSDMAIGIAMIMGFKLAKNFDFPYKSKNISEFWHRWHISLSTWMRDYIYIPLGGNRKGTLRTYLNNLITMLMAGLWHGAGWKFIFWGGMHGIGLIVHRAFRNKLKKLPDIAEIKIASWLLTMLFVTVTFVYFRAENAHDAVVILRTIVCDFHAAYIKPFIEARSAWVIMLSAIIIAHALPTRWWERMGEWFVRSPWIIKLLILLVEVQLVIEFRNSDVQPFIYFQF